MNLKSVCKHAGACLTAAVLLMTVKPLFGAGPLLAFSNGEDGKRHPVTLERTETAGAVELFAQVDAMTVRLRRRAESMDTWAFMPPEPVLEQLPAADGKTAAPAPSPAKAGSAAKPAKSETIPAKPEADEVKPEKKTLLEKIFARKNRSEPNEAKTKDGKTIDVDAPDNVRVRTSGELPNSVRVTVRTRRETTKAQASKPAAVPETEEPDDPEVFVLWYSGRPYRFDRSGQPIVNRKLLRDDDREVLSRLAVFFGSVRWRLPKNVRPRFDGKHRSLIPWTAPVFAGFEDDRYQEHDEIIERCCREFNRDRARWVGANPNAVLNIPPLSPALVKSLMIEESGGGDPKSREAWAVDPMQVNVPGDWSEAKAELGLPKPSARNEGTPDRNIRAGIKFLARKGFGVSGRSVGNRPKAYFDSWRTALRRYNGRVDVQGDGRTFRASYADRIRRRAEHPTREVPIGSN